MLVKIKEMIDNDPALFAVTLVAGLLLTVVACLLMFQGKQKLSSSEGDISVGLKNELKNEKRNTIIRIIKWN